MELEYEGKLLVVRSEDEEQEVELDIGLTPKAGRAYEIGMAVEKMLLASGGGDVTITVSLFAQ